MAIDYKPVGWDTSKFVNPSNLNKMDDGIKAACDGVDALNENIAAKNIKTYTTFTQIDENYASNNFMYGNMPKGSILQYSVNASVLDGAYANGLIPVEVVGELVVFSGSSGRGHIEYHAHQGFTYFANENLPNITDNSQIKWKKISIDREGTVLWTNPDSTAEFGAQTITLSEDISNYEYYDIEYCYASSSSTNRSVRFKTGKIGRNARTRLMTHAQYNFTRQINAPSGTSMEIGDCNRYSSYGSDETEIANTVLVPIRVIGYKNL